MESPGLDRAVPPHTRSIPAHSDVHAPLRGSVWVFAALFIPVYFLAAYLSDVVADHADGISPWFPPAGLAMAAGVILGVRAAPVIAVADVVQLVVRGADFTFAEALALGTFQALVWTLAGVIVRARVPPREPLVRMRELLWFGGVGVILAPGVAALGGMGLILALQGDGFAGYASGVPRYFVGDAIGVLGITPAALSLSALVKDSRAWRRTRDDLRAMRGEAVVMAVATVVWPVLTIVMFDGGLLPAAPLPLVWIALRAGMPAAGLAAAAWASSSVVAYAFRGSAIDLTRIDASLLAGGALALVTGALVSERERGRARRAYLALHDDVTGLPNRRQFLTTVTDALTRGDRSDVAVLVVHIGRIASLGESHGSVAVDGVLQRAADLLRRTTSADATIARLGLDRFVVMLDGVSAVRADDVAARILQTLRAPIDWDGGELLLQPCVGVATATDEKDPMEMIDRAIQAVGRAADHQTGLVRFDQRMERGAHDRARLAHDLRGAVARESLTLAYQPIVTVDGGRRVHGAEALLRWQRDGVAVGPDTFIPIAEDTGLMLPLGRWVLQTACRAACAWPSTMTVHVNVSPLQLGDERFVDDVAAALEETGLDARRLWLEITETGMREDLGRATERLTRLAHLGVRIALDDFGTGFSSLHRLQRMPVEALKIDRSFVRLVDDQPVDASIITATAQLATAMGLQVVAEGVETESQLHTLARLGCHTVQGYLICPPVNDAEFRAWLAEHHAADAEAVAP